MCYKESTQLKPGVVDIPIIPSFKRQRQEDHEYKARLDYIAERKRERYDKETKKTRE